MTIEPPKPAPQRVLSVCDSIMQRRGLKPFDREGNRHFYWLISPALVYDDWVEGVRHEIAGIPVVLAPGGSSVELLRWVDGAEVSADSRTDSRANDPDGGSDRAQEG